MKKSTILFLFIHFWIYCLSQNPLDPYIGGWAGKMNEPNAFNFTIELREDKQEQFKIDFIGPDTISTILLSRDNNNYLKGRSNNQLDVSIEITDERPIVFIQTGNHLSYIHLDKVQPDIWSGSWNLLISENIIPTFYLSLDSFNNGNYGASTFFKEPTFHSMFGQEFSNKKTEFEFIDIRSNIKFKGILKEGRIDLIFNFLNESTVIELSPLPYDQWEIGVPSLENKNPNSLRLSNNKFSRLLQDVVNDTLEGTHSVLISQKGEMIFEHYFDGFSANLPHDTRSLSKSFASALIGIAISKNILKDEKTPIIDFFETIYPDINWSNGKDSITLHHLLTMSSGLDAIDFGLNRMSYANEGAYQNQADWTKHILSSPMINQVGKIANYGSGSPHLLSPILSNQLEEDLAFFIHKSLFQPLGILNYRIQTNNKSEPYLGGGWYFTPRDLMKFGQLYLNKGNWEGEQIIPEEWINQSMDKHVVLENTINKNQYGYLFWHKTYNLNNKNIHSIEARGSGGQYLFIIPEYDLVAVITSGNYRNNKGFQPERIMHEYILKELIK